MNSVTEAFFRDGFVRIGSTGPWSDADLVGLASSFGPLVQTVLHTTEHDSVQRVANDGLFGTGVVEWHSDWSYGPGDFHGTLLYNHHGGEHCATEFADLAELAKSVPVSRRHELRGVKAGYAPPEIFQTTCFTKKQRRMIKAAKVERALVFTHPTCGEDVIYFSPATRLRPKEAASDRSLTESEEAALLRRAEEIAWRHEWRPHDVILFDNLRFIHRRGAFNHSRELRRIQFAPDYAGYSENRLSAAS